MSARKAVTTTGPATDPRVSQLDAISYLLDNSIPVPGTRARFGLDAIIGLIPGLGDAAGSLISAYIVVQAARLGTAVPVLLRMLLNVGIEALVGAIPLAGDLFDAAFKANVRNVALLRREVTAPGSQRRSSLLVVLFVILALVAVLGTAGYLAYLFLIGLFTGNL